MKLIPDLIQKSTYEWAKEYTKNGLAVNPVAPHQKIPIQKNWSKLPIPSEDTLKKWFEGKSNNIAIRTGRISGIFVVDVDPKDGGDVTIAQLESYYGDLPTTVRVETPSGGWHLYFQLPENVTIRNSASTKLGAGIDVRGEGGQVVAPPSVVNGVAYFSDGDEGPENRKLIAHAPQWLIDKCVQTAKRVPKDQQNISHNLLHIEKGRNNALTSLAGTLRARGINENSILVSIRSFNVDHCVPPLEEAELVKIAHSVANYEPSPLYTEIWREGMQTARDGTYKGTSGNVTLILAHDQRTATKIYFDALHGQVCSGEELPWKKKAGSWQEIDYIGAKQWLGNSTMCGYEMAEPSMEAVYHGVMRCAYNRQLDPLREYLKGLQWDGVLRIDTLLSDHFSAENNSYTQAVARILIIGAVHRACMPGCKLDYMPILQGPQGCGKTSGLIALFDPYYKEMTGTTLNSAAAHELQGAWVLEIAELQQYGRSAEDQAKAFLTRQVDVYRPPYGRDYLHRPRRCLLVGTTNDDEFLRDMTGNRRYLPVAVGEIDRDALTANKNQLFAEAMATGIEWDEEKKEYKPKINLWLTGDAQRLAQEYQENAMVADPWQDLLEIKTQEKDKVSTADLLSFLEIPNERQEVKTYTRISNIMRKLGWRRGRVRSHKGNLVRGFVRG